MRHLIEVSGVWLKPDAFYAIADKVKLALLKHIGKCTINYYEQPGWDHSDYGMVIERSSLTKDERAIVLDLVELMSIDLGLNDGDVWLTLNGNKFKFWYN